LNVLTNLLLGPNSKTRVATSSTGSYVHIARLKEKSKMLQDIGIADQQNA